MGRMLLNDKGYVQFLNYLLDKNINQVSKDNLIEYFRQYSGVLGEKTLLDHIEKMTKKRMLLVAMNSYVINEQVRKYRNLM